MSIPEKIWLFRIVHWENVEYILDNGMTCREHPLYDSNYVNIGMKQLINDRHNHPIRFENAGNLGEYIPFYFGTHSPMLYMIKNGYSGVTQRPQHEIVYIITSMDKIVESNCEYLYTDMHAKRAICSFYNDDENLDKIDWEVVKSKEWYDTEEYRDRRDRKQAEFMVRNEVPVSCIEHIVVKSEERRNFINSLVEERNLNIPVSLNNRLYY